MAVMAAAAFVGAGAVAAGVAVTTVMTVGTVLVVVGAVTKKPLLMQIGGGLATGGAVAGAAGLGASSQAAAQQVGQQGTQQAVQKVAVGTANAGVSSSTDSMMQEPVASSAPIGPVPLENGQSWFSKVYGGLDSGDKAAIGGTINGMARGAAQYMAARDQTQAVIDTENRMISRVSAMPRISFRDPKASQPAPSQPTPNAPSATTRPLPSTTQG